MRTAEPTSPSADIVFRFMFFVSCLFEDCVVLAVFPVFLRYLIFFLEHVVTTCSFSSITFNNKPQTSENGKVKFIYCKTPEGAYLELVEEAKKSIKIFNADEVKQLVEKNEIIIEE